MSIRISGKCPKNQLYKIKSKQQIKQILNQLIKLKESVPKSNMSRKPSYDSDLSMSVRLNYSTKDYSGVHSYTKSPKNFDKFSSQVLDRNASQQTHYTSVNNQFSAIRKLPQSISSIRQTFSFNSPSSYRRYDLDQTDHSTREKTSKLTDALRQTMDIRSIKRNNDYNLAKSVSGYLNNTAIDQFYTKSQSQISQQYPIRRPYQSKREEVKSYSHINKLYQQRPYNIEEEIKKIREQNQEKKANKRSQPQQQPTLTYTKSYTNIQEQKTRNNFAKKNYVEYYTPKVQKTQYNDKYIPEGLSNVLSPQYNSKAKKDTSFDTPPQSPRKVTDIKDVKSIKVNMKDNNNNNNNNSAKKKAPTEKLTIDDFYIGKSLGQGRFGTAHMAFHKASGAIFAIKKVKKETIKANKLVDQFILEVKLQSYLVHPFILKIYAVFDDEAYIYLILQFMEQGTLFNYLKKFKKLSQQDTAQKIRYLAESIKYLQDRGIAHRDIKPENIIMSNEVCKLADFGWATFCDEQRRKTYCGTCDYVAPQILQGHQYDQTVDLWCMGVLTYQLMTGKAPFYHMSIKETKKKIINVSLTYPEEFSENLKLFISGLIQKDPEQRMSIEEVLKHGFIKHIKLSQ